MGLLFATSLAAALLGGCGGHRDPANRPVATLSTSPQAQIAFASLRTRWATQTRAGRAELREPLERFLGAYPNDGAIPLARAYYVFVLLDAGATLRAGRFLTTLEATVPPGATRDLVTIGRAAELRVLNQPDDAFDLLRPLVGKVVDPPARALLEETVSLAAIEAHRDYEAIAYLDAWLRNVAEEDHDAVRAKVVKALASLPAEVLDGQLRSMRARGAASGYGREIQRLVTERLVEITLDKQDPELARWLLDPSAGATLVGGHEGELSELASIRRGEQRVDARTVGLLLPSGSDDLRGAAADVLRGVAWGLDLPRGGAGDDDGDGTKLSTRDDGGDPAKIKGALAELASEGAALIVAALDTDTADVSIAWAEENHVPLLALATPSNAATQTSGARDFAFVLGVSRDDELRVAEGALQDRGLGNVAPLVSPSEVGLFDALRAEGVSLLAPVTCTWDAAPTDGAPYPWATWRTAQVRAWLVDGPPNCARDLVHALGARRQKGVVVLTLEAAPVRERATGVNLLAVSAGSYPFGTTATNGAASPLSRVPDAQRFLDSTGSPPSFFTALGRDAAALARAAVQKLPLDATSDAAQIQARRTAVRDALKAARPSLWTTTPRTPSPPNAASNPAMASDHRVDRTLEVRGLVAPPYKR